MNHRSSLTVSSTALLQNKQIQELKQNIISSHEEYIHAYEESKKSQALRFMKGYISEYLNLVPQDQKFKFPSTERVIGQSVKKFGPNFDPREAAGAFEHLARYAHNLIEEPWREEYKTLKLTCGFYYHNISAYLHNAHEVLISMGYVNLTDTTLKFVPSLKQPVDFEILKEVSRDLFIASQECIILSQIYEQIQLEEPANHPGIDEVFAFRQEYLGNVNTIATSILYKIRSDRQKMLAFAHANENAINRAIPKVGNSAFVVTTKGGSKGYSSVEKHLEQTKLSEEDLLMLTPEESNHHAYGSREEIKPSHESWLDEFNPPKVFDNASRSRKPVQCASEQEPPSRLRSSGKDSEGEADAALLAALEYQHSISSTRGFNSRASLPASNSHSSSSNFNKDRSRYKPSESTKTLPITQRPKTSSYSNHSSSSKSSSSSSHGHRGQNHQMARENDERDPTISYSKLENSPKRAGGGKSSPPPPLETNLDSLDVVFYQTLLTRSKVPGYEGDADNVPPSYYRNEGQERGPEAEVTVNHLPPPVKPNNNINNSSNSYPSKSRPSNHRRSPLEREDPSFGYERLSEEPPEWSCRHCTFLNSSAKNVCEVCSKTNQLIEDTL